MLLISLVGCSKQDSDPLGSSEEINDMILKSLIVREGTINLQGVQRWYVYAKKEHKLIVNPADMFTMCTAELIFKDDQNFELNTTEFIGDDPFK